jgi:hypothetical protein
MKQVLSILLGLLFIVSASFAAGVWLDPWYGDSGLMNQVGCTYEYQCIDDGSVADSSDYIYSAGLSPGNLSPVYYLGDLPSEASSVNYVRIYYYAATNQVTLMDGGEATIINKRRITPALYSMGNTYVDYHNSIYTPLFDYSWNHYSSRTYYDNPVSERDWTVSEVNLLRAGYSLGFDNDGPKIGRIRVYVNYNTE